MSQQLLDNNNSKPKSFFLAGLMLPLFYVDSDFVVINRQLL